MSSTTEKRRKFGDSDQQLMLMDGGAFLPDEIMGEILQWLPVKSLKRFECVSKSWLSFISSPQFIKAHLRLNQSLPNQRQLLLMGHKRCETFWSKHCSFSSLLLSNQDQDHSVAAAGIDVIPLEIIPPKKRYRGHLYCVGCCDGLVCVAIGMMAPNFYLCNPSTKKSQKLPEFLERKVDYRVSSYGFGNDSRADDYKLVVIVYKSDVVVDDPQREVHVYSIKTQSWRRIEDFPNATPLHHPGALLNGKLHWALEESPAGPFGPLLHLIPVQLAYGPIVSLDLATETYGELEKPRNLQEYCDCSVGTIREDLCMLYEFPGSPSKLWVMKKYGVAESWTPVLSIKLDLDDPLFVTPCIVNDEYLMVYNNRLGLYHPKDHSFSICKRLAGFRIFTVHCFGPSLQWS